MQPVTETDMAECREFFTTSIKGQVMHWWGDGANGKSTLVYQLAVATGREIGFADNSFTLREILESLRCNAGKLLVMQDHGSESSGWYDYLTTDQIEDILKAFNCNMLIVSQKSPTRALGTVVHFATRFDRDHGADPMAVSAAQDAYNKMIAARQAL